MHEICLGNFIKQKFWSKPRHFIHLFFCIPCIHLYRQRIKHYQRVEYYLVLNEAQLQPVSILSRNITNHSLMNIFIDDSTDNYDRNKSVHQKQIKLSSKFQSILQVRHNCDTSLLSQLNATSKPPRPQFVHSNICPSLKFDPLFTFTYVIIS